MKYLLCLKNLFFFFFFHSMDRSGLTQFSVPDGLLEKEKDNNKSKGRGIIDEGKRVGD